jgi:hypothetical protein
MRPIVRHFQVSAFSTQLRSMTSRVMGGIAFLLAAFLLVVPAEAGTTLYVTADNGAGTNLFGTLNLKTGRFTEIAQTTPLFYALTTGPGNRLYGADLDTGTLFTISRTGVTEPYGSITAPGFDSGTTYGFLGLVHQKLGWDDEFLAVNVDPKHVSLYSISRRGGKLSDLGIIEGPHTGVFFNGSLAYGPLGKLYFDFVPHSGPQLYTIDPSTGSPTPVGSGLGTDILSLVSDGVRLYGIDTDVTSHIGIYTIDPKTGVAAPTGVIVRGLPHTKDFYIDTATFAEDDLCDP